MKYKNILKGYKEIFNELEKKNHNPMLTNRQNIQNTINIMGERLNNYNQKNDTDKEASYLAAVTLKALIDDMNNNIIHYFINNEHLYNFLKETEIKDSSIVKTFIYENKNGIHDDVGYYTVALHTEKEAYVFTYIQNKDRTVIVCIDEDTGSHFDLGDKVSDPISKLAINLIYYMKCFPEKVVDGVPNDMVKNDRKKMSSSKCYSLGIAEEIVDKTEIIDGRTVIPHFRSGFFRHYTDDRYVNMKGKVQFIAATMVKGKAKTVVV